MALKYKIGDKVRIKSLDWYNENKDDYGYVWCTEFLFTPEHSKYCGRELIISHVTEFEIPSYVMESNGHDWTNEMIEGLVEEETKPEPKFKVGDKITNGEITFTILTLSSDRYGAEDTFGECGSVCFKSQDEWKIVEEEMKSEDGLLDEYEELTDRAFKGGYEKCKSDIELNGFQLPEGYQFVDENGNVINATKIVLEKKKREYPKTYEECCQYLGCDDKIPLKIIGEFTRLINARNAYWKLYGEEMGLGKPWEPDWNIRGYYGIARSYGNVIKTSNYNCDLTFVFPTEEMRDAFYENFKEEIEICKELL